jgi:16S rRNA processing protein RimM
VPDLVEVGYVARAHGVRGEVRVHLHNAQSDALFTAETVYLRETAYAVDRARPGSNGGVLLTLAGVLDRDAAEALRGSTVAIARDDVGLEDGEFLTSDLVGCKAVLADGTPWGEVVEVIPGAQDRLVIRDGDVERELPLVDALVPSVDIEARTIVVEPPEGLPEQRRRR